MAWFLCLEGWNGRAKALYEGKAWEMNGIALSVDQLECMELGLGMDEELTG